MRSENEMFDLLIRTAKKDDRIRAVFMNGSRANPNAKKDIFQDYDIVYVVRDVLSFLEEENWIQVFGDILIMQEPDKLDRMRGYETDFVNHYTYLMQFTDGNRIDLTLQSVEHMNQHFGSEKMTVVLLDKDQCLKKITKASDSDYYVKRPTYGEFYSCCNEFWWVAPYVAKGLWRDEILFANEAMNAHVRKELLTMLGWYVGCKNNFGVSVGKSYKYLREFINADIWERLLLTYAMENREKAWKSLFICCELFEEIAGKVGIELGYTYESREFEKSFPFLRHIMDLPKDAEGIY